jgi:hypothetical protein
LGGLAVQNAYRDKKVVGVFVHFFVPLHLLAELTAINSSLKEKLV